MMVSLKLVFLFIAFYTIFSLLIYKFYFLNNKQTHFMRWSKSILQMDKAELSLILKGKNVDEFILQVFNSTDINWEVEIDKIKEKRPCYGCRVSNKYMSTCGRSSDDLGLGQKVVSYSFYKGNNEFESYLRGIETNVETLRQVYNSKITNRSKSWIIRIYSDLEMPHYLADNYPNVLFWCDVREILPGGYLKISKMSWRYLPLGDPTVDIFLSRDLDGVLTEREWFAVNEWLNSNYSFHSMRDHPYHTHHFMAGMWGANNNILGMETARRIRQNILEAGIMNDQVALTKFIWINFSDQVFAHDSFLCQKVEFGNNSRPWPTQRETSSDYVGKIVLRPKYKKKYIIKAECPIECRPPTHKDWKYC